MRSVTYSYADACRNIFNTVKTSGHSFLEKIYLSLYSKGLCVRGNRRPNRTTTYCPPNSSGYNSISFPFSWAAQLGDWRSSLLWDLVLIPASSLQLICLPVTPQLYNYLTSTCLLWASKFTLNSTLRQSRLSPTIFDRMHLLFTQVHFLFWQLGQGPICIRSTPLLPNYQVRCDLEW